MTVKLTYRELQRLNSGELLKQLGNDIALIYVDSQPMFKVRVVSEKDLTLDSQRGEAKNGVPRDSQRNSLKNGKGHDSQATGTGGSVSTLTVKPTHAELQAMINQKQGHDSRKVVDDPPAPWYNPEVHTTRDTVRMKDPRTGVAKTVTL